LRRRASAGIRGSPPDLDFEAALEDVLLRAPYARLNGEADEQGLQIAAVSRRRRPAAVPLNEVSLCSPLPFHRNDLGSCGAHFAGINMRRPRPQHGCTRATLDLIAANWDANLPVISGKVDARYCS
jgi:hypothetical protein